MVVDGPAQQGNRIVIVATYEDRPANWIGLKLLVLSLARHCPFMPVHVFVREGQADLRNWLRRQPNVAELVEFACSARGWDVKPRVLQNRLAVGHRDVLWMDSDIIVTRDFSGLIGRLPLDVFLATEEIYWGKQPRGSEARTEAMGLEVGRKIRETLNSSVIRTTVHHRDLLEAWTLQTNRAEYCAAQAMPFRERPICFRTDQDLLTGLLGSTQYAQIPVQLLRRGRDIAHCYRDYGYTVIDRLRNLRRGLPPLVHGMGPPKPWLVSTRLHDQLSPYSCAAKAYTGAVRESMEWVMPHSHSAWFLHCLTVGNPNLRDLPLVLVKELKLHGRARLANLWRAIARRASQRPIDRL